MRFCYSLLISCLVLSITPNSFALSLNENNYHKVLNKTQFVVYWGGWLGMVYDLKNLPAKVSTVNLAFADIDNQYQVDTLVSGSLTIIPKENRTQLQPSYINWTQYKYNHPTTNILLSLGGSTFSQIWTHKLSTTTVDTIAKNIAVVINRTYPVYSGNFASASEKLGEVTIDGIDLDVETGGNRLSAEVSANVVNLIQKLKIYLKPGKLITFTGFSVGADPGGQCSVPGSVHCGEDVDILTQAGPQLDWVNVMAYDAGLEFATSKYQIALSNFSTYIGKNKTILGLDLQSQWDPNHYFQETVEQLANKAAWQNKQGYGGAMLWAVNITNDPKLEQSYVDAISNQL